RPRPDPGRRGRASPGQARVHPAGDRVRQGTVHDLRTPRGLRDRLGREAARGQLPPQGPLGPRLRRVHRGPDRIGRPARRPPREALPPRRRDPPPPGPPSPRPRRSRPPLTPPPPESPHPRNDTPTRENGHG